MKVQITTSENKTQLSLQAETPQENLEILKTVRRTRKPNQAWGGYNASGFAWAYINMPAKKLSDWQATRFDSE